MTTGHWYTNGRYLMNPGVSGAFTWNGATTTYALYAALVSSDIYTPDPYTDVYLSDAIATAAEPALATGYQRQPVRLAAITKAQKTTPTADFVIYPADQDYSVSWSVNINQTMTAGWIIFYWDQNVAHSLIDPLTAYYPSGSNNTYDDASPLIAYGTFVDSITGDNYWTTTTTPALVAYSYDTSFDGYSTLLSSQVL